MAESEGFEPSKGLSALYSLSRRAPSTDSANSPCSCSALHAGRQYTEERRRVEVASDASALPRVQREGHEEADDRAAGHSVAREHLAAVVLDDATGHGKPD